MDSHFCYFKPFMYMHTAKSVVNSGNHYFMIKFKVTKRHLKNVALGALTSCNDDA